MLPLISIQILNWNRAEDTQRAIQSAITQSYPNIEIVLVDNGSTDNSISLTKQNFPDIKIIELGENHGCPGGRNLGIPHCSGRYIFFLDNDGILHNKAVENAYRSITRSKNVGIVTGTIYDFNTLEETDQFCSIRSNIQYYHNNFQGGICLHDTDIYVETGLYPPHFMYGAEESFMVYKLADTSYNIVKDESVVLWHKRSDLARNRAKELEHSYYNKLYIAITLFPLFHAILFVLYFIPVYSYYSYKAGFLKQFLQGYGEKLTHTIRLGLRDRNPISGIAYKKVRGMKSKRRINF